ncbi:MULTISPECIES: hypothetical protein [unclassified Bradyrhizobium]|uniref:hypothetical protein n=1 Tax=unclassified Bradyrhizobium TaxID=2631580 RepID=UPI002916F6E3|nr:MULTISPECIES: hypothetical protein [unclassified Bradyrhizobium]
MVFRRQTIAETPTSRLRRLHYLDLRQNASFRHGYNAVRQEVKTAKAQHFQLESPSFCSNPKFAYLHLLLYCEYTTQMERQGVEPVDAGLLFRRKSLLPSAARSKFDL